MHCLHLVHGPFLGSGNRGEGGLKLFCCLITPSWICKYVLQKPILTGIAKKFASARISITARMKLECLFLKVGYITLPALPCSNLQLSPHTAKSCSLRTTESCQTHPKQPVGFPSLHVFLLGPWHRSCPRIQVKSSCFVVRQWHLVVRMLYAKRPERPQSSRALLKRAGLFFQTGRDQAA